MAGDTDICALAVRHHIDEASLAGRDGQRRIQVGHAERACLERRADELQALLAEERRRIDGLYTDLADAGTAAMISGADAAALRTQLELLTARRPWWRRWFR